MLLSFRSCNKRERPLSVLYLLKFATFARGETDEYSIAAVVAKQYESL